MHGIMENDSNISIISIISIIPPLPLLPPSSPPSSLAHATLSAPPISKGATECERSAAQHRTAKPMHRAYGMFHRTTRCGAVQYTSTNSTYMEVGAPVVGSRLKSNTIVGLKGLTVWLNATNPSCKKPGVVGSFDNVPPRGTFWG